MRKYYLIFTGLVSLICLFSGCGPRPSGDQTALLPDYSNGKHWTRWWWHASVFSEDDIRNQLIWLRDNNFGGVEVTFIYPVNRDYLQMRNSCKKPCFAVNSPKKEEADAPPASCMSF